MPIVTIQDFTGVYAEQPFMQKLRESAATDNNLHWLDCTKIEGTDCYCDDEAQATINKMMDEAVAIATNASAASAPSIHFFDNGNYHYMSKLWTDRVQEPFDLVVFDHHPDMQPPRFEGILSCGGWVLEVLKNNPFVQSVTLIGVADHLVDEIREWITSLPSDARNDVNGALLNRVKFIRESELKCELTDLSSHFTFHIVNSLCSFTKCWARSYPCEHGCDTRPPHLSTPVYVSIDKDALSTSEAATNWDQGSLTFAQLAETLTTLAQKHKILGIDICGERARDMDFADTAAADALNNALNEKLYHFLTSLVEKEIPAFAGKTIAENGIQ